MDTNDFYRLDKNELLIRLNEKLRQTKGFEVNERLQWLDYCLFIFKENHKSLELFSQQAGRQSVAIEMFGSEDYTSEVQGNFARHLHNFLVSSQSLVEHTRRLMRKWYVDTEMLVKYQDAVNKNFINDPLSQFIEALRNYCTHRSPVGIIIKTFPGKDSDCNVVSIHKDTLISWNKISKHARLYIEQYDNDIPIMTPVNEYKDKVVQFREELRQEIVSFHAEDIQHAKWFFQAIEYVENDDIDGLVWSMGILKSD
jgi:hypothetical protein